MASENGGVTDRRVEGLGENPYLDMLLSLGLVVARVDATLQGALLERQRVRHGYAGRESLSVLR